MSTYLLDFFEVPFFALLFFVADFFAPPFALLLEADFFVPPFDDAFLVAIGCSCSFFLVGLEPQDTVSKTSLWPRLNGAQHVGYINIMTSDVNNIFY
ncbi:MAG: hypothetical protein M3R15_03135, partial [Acidobacteriota bacterium]|nr:hypothetical protein [Acidobacteriota bacterium]